jgi:hypothetical protein
MSSAEDSVLPFPTPAKAPEGDERLVEEIRESIRCITAALSRSQRRLNEISRILSEIERRPRAAESADLTAPESCLPSVESSVRSEDGQAGSGNSPRVLVMQKCTHSPSSESMIPDKSNVRKGTNSKQPASDLVHGRITLS